MTDTETINDEGIFTKKQSIDVSIDLKTSPKSTKLNLQKTDNTETAYTIT